MDDKRHMDGRRNDRTSAIIDNVLRLTITTGAIGAGLLIPNLLVALEKPLDIFWKHLDKRERERELRRALVYMKSRKLIQTDYDHGLQITQKGKNRLAKLDLDKIVIPKPKTWDRKWRLVFYDIPEEHKTGRNALVSKLNELGFYQLQRSAWLHPFPCREAVEAITTAYSIDPYITYVETSYIDNQTRLVQKFQKLLSG